MTTAPASTQPNPTADGSTLPPTQPGQPTNDIQAPMSTTQKWLIGIVAGAVLIIATLGFIGSYEAVSKLAEQKKFGSFAQAFPIAIDAGIVAFLALDLLLTWRRIPYPLLRQGAWLLTAATIAFNAAAAWPDWLGVGMHAVIPVLFVIAVEAARHAVGRIADITADKHIENPPLIRWFVAPFSTAYIWRRMRKWHIRQYTEAIQHQKEVKVYRAQLRKVYGRVGKAPAEKLLVLTLAGFGMSVAEAIEMPAKEEAKRVTEQNRIDQEKAEAKRKAEAEANRRAEAEAEAKHQEQLREAEAEAKRRKEIAEAEAAEAEAEARVATARSEARHRQLVAEAETEANLKAIQVQAATAEAEANQNLQANLLKEQEAARVAKAEADDRINEIARQRQIQADQDEQERLQRHHRDALELKRLEDAVRKQQAAEAAAKTEAKKKAEAHAEVLRLREQASASTSGTRVSASGSKTTAVAASASGPASVSVRVSGPAAITNRRSKRQSEIDDVLALIVQSGDPKSVSLKWIEQQYGLTQTTAYDRLSTAQQLWADGQSKTA